MSSAGEAAAQHAVCAVSPRGNPPGCFVLCVVTSANWLVSPVRAGVSSSVNCRYKTAELFLKHPAPPVVRFNDAAVYKQLMRDFPQVCLVLFSGTHPLLMALVESAMHEPFVDGRNPCS
jgi:hypothetical protein